MPSAIAVRRLSGSDVAPLAEVRASSVCGGRVPGRGRGDGGACRAARAARGRHPPDPGGASPPRRVDGRRADVVRRSPDGGARSRALRPAARASRRRRTWRAAPHHHPRGRRDFVRSLFAELAALDPSGPGARRAPPIRAESLVALLLAEIGDHAPALVARSSGASERGESRARVHRHARAGAALARGGRAGIGHNRSYVAELVRRETGRIGGRTGSPRFASTKRDAASRRQTS